MLSGNGVLHKNFLYLWVYHYAINNNAWMNLKGHDLWTELFSFVVYFEIQVDFLV